MDDKPKTEGNLRDEFGNLGKNLTDILHTAWNSVEGTRIQEELTTGITELGTTLRREAENIASSSTAQQIKEEVQQVGERVRSTEFQNTVQRELLTTLQTVNRELQKVINNWSSAQSSSTSQAGSPVPEDQVPSEPPAPEPPTENSM